MSEPTRERDDVTGVETTGHEWDGIKELNTPLPRWWLWTFYATIVWAIGYTIAYPAWPLINSATTGVLQANGDFDFPTLLAQCRPASAPAAERLAPALPHDARRG